MACEGGAEERRVRNERLALLAAAEGGEQCHC